jgi:hypothetical protein
MPDYVLELASCSLVEINAGLLYGSGASPGFYQKSFSQGFGSFIILPIFLISL